MSRLPRNTDPKYFRHISIRTENARLTLLPEPRLNAIVGGVLAKYQQHFGILLYAYSILSNHVHILAQAPKKNLWRFEQAVNREIAKRANRLRNTRGHYWERRYDEQMIASEADIIEAFLYVTCNAVSHGLIAHPKLWPGVNSYAHCLDEKDRAYLFTDYTAFGKACRQAKAGQHRVSIRDFQTEHRLVLTPLPHFAELAPEARRAVLHALIQKRLQRIRHERAQQGLGFLGREMVLNQQPQHIPRNVKRMPRPICYTKFWEAKRQFMAWFFPWLEHYREASRNFRAGNFGFPFPEFSLLPPGHYSLVEG